MNSRYICTTCTRRLRRGLGHQSSPQFLQKAKFIPLNGQTPRDEPAAADNPISEQKRNTDSSLNGAQGSLPKWKPKDPLEGLLSRSSTRSSLAGRFHQALPLHAASSERSPPVTLVEEASTEDDPQSIAFATIKTLNRALDKQDLRRLNLLWREARDRYPARVQARPEVQSYVEHVQRRGKTSRPRPLAESNPDRVDSKMPSALYDRFIMAFMALRQFEKAVDVWNDMILVGHQPTLASWHAFLDGCRKARDTDRMEAIWKNMRSAGVRPDVGCWTTRIHGLIGCGRWQLGMEALQEMGKIWLEACRAQERRTSSGNQNESINLAALGDIGGTVKPTTETVNAAMSALLGFGKVQAAQNVLRWGKSLGIAPDVITFNTLLKPIIKAGKSSQALGLLSEMESLGVKPDVATFTILLDGLFRTSTIEGTASDSSHTAATDPGKEQQKQATLAINFLDQMEAFGIPPTTHSYSTLIDGLLKYHANLPAARAVLGHMAARNIRPTAHIYTILLTHHFSQSPPDLPAIDTLWQRILLSNDVVDHIFYDRIIEGYARVGDTGKLLYFLRRLPREGKTPSWDALSEAVTALVKASDKENAALVVEDVRKGTGLAKDGIRGWNHKMAFWELVDMLEGQGYLKSPTFERDSGIHEKKRAD